MKNPKRRPEAPKRVILHLDMDAFFAAVEVREDPSLKGVPLIIGRRGPRGVVSTCSYEARAFGIRSAMPSVKAERLCPGAVWLSPRMDLYAEVSRRIADILQDVSPVVEKVSIDEAFIDLTGIASDLAHGSRMACQIKEKIFRQEQLTASVGISFNKLLAKMASDLDKPDGLVIVSPQDLEMVIWPLPVNRLWGVGPKATARLKKIGVSTIGGLFRVPEPKLVQTLGASTAQHLLSLARGEDARPVVPERERKSISEERTYLEDLTDPLEIEGEIFRKAEAVGYALRTKGLSGRTVHLKIRTGDFTTWTRSRTLENPTDLSADIFSTALELYRSRIELGGKGVRLIGVGVSGLSCSAGTQLEMFGDEDLQRRLSVATDAVKQKFGREAITRARLIKKRPRKEPP